MSHPTYLPCVKCGAAQGEPCRSLVAPFAESVHAHVPRARPVTHGTVSGFQREKRNGETPCQPCRDAQNRYMREYRSDPTVKAQTATENSARSRAVWRLAALHRQEYGALVREEMGKAFGEVAS